MPAMRNCKKNSDDVQFLLFREWLSIFLSKSYKPAHTGRDEMVKLVALFRKSERTEEFEAEFEGKVLPLLRQIPGLARIELTNVTGAAFGDSKYALMAELYFADRPGLDAAMASREGKAVARELLRFASEVSSLFHGEIREERNVPSP